MRTVYWAAGLLGGIVFGLIKPLARRRLGAVAVGIVVAAPACAAIALAVDGKNVAWGAVLIIAVIFGIAGGLALSNTAGPSLREIEELEDTTDRLLAGELTDEEIAAFDKRYGTDKPASRR